MWVIRWDSDAALDPATWVCSSFLSVSAHMAHEDASSGRAGDDGTFLRTGVLWSRSMGS